MGDNAAPRIDCPDCTSVAWTDGAFEFRSDGVRTDIHPVSHEASTDGPWLCSVCGRALEDTAVSEALNQLEDARSA